MGRRFAAFIGCVAAANGLLLACRVPANPESVPPESHGDAAVPSDSPHASAAPTSLAPTSLPPHPAPESLGTTCRPVDAKGRAAAGRLVGIEDPARVVAAQCGEGEWLELGVSMVPRSRYQVKVLTLDAVKRVSVRVEVHPEVATDPLVQVTTELEAGEPAVPLADQGVVWTGDRVVPARVIFEVEQGGGLLIAGFAEVTSQK